MGNFKTKFMKRLLLFLFTFFTIQLMFSQNPLLLGKNWQFEKISKNNDIVNAPSEPQAYYLQFYTQSDLFNYEAEICLENFGKLTYNDDNQSFIVKTLNVPSQTCSNAGLSDFENAFRQFFTESSASGNKVNYIINASANGYTLILSNQTGSSVYLKYVYPDAYLANAEWQLNELNISGVHYTKPDYFTPANSIFRTSYNAVFFNSTGGPIGYLQNKNFKIIGGATTLAQSGDSAIDFFDGQFHDVFLRNIPDKNHFTYHIESNQLIMTNSVGDKAYFNKKDIEAGITIRDKNWYLTSLTQNGQTYIPTLSNRTIKFENNLFNASYFNVLNSTVLFDTESVFDIYNANVTIVDSYDDDIALFDYWYLENFFGIRSNSDYLIVPNNPFSYFVSADGNTLTITNVKGDVAVYSKEMLSLKEISGSPIKIYPNPASDFVTISSSGSMMTLGLADSSGKILVKKDLKSAKKAEFNLKNYPSGIYYLIVNGKEIHKIIKQ